MTTEAGGPVADATPAIAAALPDEISLEDARSIIDSWGDPEKNQNIEGVDQAEAEEVELHLASAKKDTSKEENADQETDPGEQKTEEAEADENPPIEPPRSWTKEAKERWAALPRETQEYLTQRESERDRGLLRSQQELAEQRKAFEAERDAVKALKQQYETSLPSLVKTLEAALQSEFSDIKDMNDAEKLQLEDPFRFQRWQLHQMKLQAAKRDEELVNSQKNQERQGKRANYEAEQNKLLMELVPEMADPKKASELRERAVGMLTSDLGLRNDQLSRWMADDTGHEILSNAGIQKLIADGLKFRDLQNAPKAVAAKPLPPVQKPGTPNRQTPVDAQIAALERKSELTEAEGFELLQLRARAGSRR